ncbi:probable mannitol dehydrogenase [Elaeis guineensis]|uniref:probable mannitol dehydrogenase n=1 Tax=Elaeis guineensis var. tenera TaxID=51953 RepID=UPI003C6D868A
MASRKAIDGWRETPPASSPPSTSRRHEIMGVITKVGCNVQKFKIGDKGFENYCPRMILAYNSIDTNGAKTYGGDSDTAGKHLGVVGLGSFGHIAVKFVFCASKALGMKVTVISSSQHNKKAVESLIADSFLLSSNSDQMKAAVGTMDDIINRVSAKHSLVPLLQLLKTHGKMIMVGLPEKPLVLRMFPLILGSTCMTTVAANRLVV